MNRFRYILGATCQINMGFVSSTYPREESRILLMQYEVWNIVNLEYAKYGYGMWSIRCEFLTLYRIKYTKLYLNCMWQLKYEIGLPFTVILSFRLRLMCCATYHKFFWLPNFMKCLWKLVMSNMFLYRYWLILNIGGLRICHKTCI